MLDLKKNSDTFCQGIYTSLEGLMPSALEFS